MTALDNVLAAAVASYAKAATVTVQETKLVKIQSAKKAKAPKAPKAVKTPSPNGEVTQAVKVTGTPGLVLPLAGTLNARGYLMMARGAKSLNEKIQAIAGYIGYNPTESFGTQEMNAAQKAKSELNPIVINGPTREERFSAARSIAGYVAGMPDNQKKTLADLLAREKNAAEERDNHAKAARNPALSAEERKVHAGQAALEHKRMLAIRQDIANL